MEKDKSDWPTIDKARLKRAAINLRDMLIAYRDENRHGWGDLAGEILDSMSHEFALAITESVGTPYDVGWGRTFGDQLSFDDLLNVYDEYVVAARAGMDSDTFCRSPFYDRYLLPSGRLSEPGNCYKPPATN